jgi:hypothetical protein
MRMLAYVGALVTVTSVTGCSVATTNAPGPAPLRTAVIVQNRSALDVEVFLWDGWDRATRIGAVRARDTVDLDVPEDVLAAVGPYALEARPTAGGEYATNSERFALRPGYRITWTIPPSEAMGAAPDDAPSDTMAGPPGQ